MCFKRSGNDLLLERIKQVDFRLVHSNSMMEQYLSSLNVKALYWHQDLMEKVAQDELQSSGVKFSHSVGNKGVDIQSMRISHHASAREDLNG